MRCESPKMLVMNLGLTHALPNPITSPCNSMFLHPAFVVVCRVLVVGWMLAMNLELQMVAPNVDPVSSRIKSRRLQLSSSEDWLWIIRLHHPFFLESCALLLLDLGLDGDPTEPSSSCFVWAWEFDFVGVCPISLYHSEREILSLSRQFEGAWLGEPQQWHLFCAKLDSDFFLSSADLDLGLLEEEEQDNFFWSSRARLNISI